MTVKLLSKLFSLLALSLALGACSAASSNATARPIAVTPTAQNIEVIDRSNLASENLTSFFSPSDDLEEQQVRHFSQAKDSIDLAIYTFSSRKVRDLLHAKLLSGVKLRIVINKGTEESVKVFLAPLIEAGAEVRTVSPVMHHKFSIVDSKLLANSSGNMGGTQYYDENLVICSNCPNRVNAFKAEFNALFTFSNPITEPNGNTGLPEGSQHSSVHVNYPDLALFTTSNFAPKFTAKTKRISMVARRLETGAGRVDSILIEAISQAKNEVKIATGHFRSKPLYDAVAAAVARGIRVTLVLDGQEYISERNQEKQDSEIEVCKAKKSESECHKTGSYFSRMLTKAGAAVYLKYYSYRWFFPYAKQMHHKYMIVDGTKLYSGSYNWSYNAEYESTENVAIYDDAALVKSFEANFADLLSYGGGPSTLSQRLEAIRTASEPIPLHFEPVSLSLNQVDQLLEAARIKCPSMYHKSAAARVCSH